MYLAPVVFPRVQLALKQSVTPLESRRAPSMRSKFVPGRVFLVELEMGGTIIPRVWGIGVDAWVGSEASF